MLSNMPRPKRTVFHIEDIARPAWLVVVVGADSFVAEVGAGYIVPERAGAVERGMRVSLRPR